MNIIQQKLVESYAVLVLAERMSLEEVPETKVIGGVEYPIRGGAEIEIARRTVSSL